MSSSKCTDQLCALPASTYSAGTRTLASQKAGGVVVKLTAQLHVVPRLRMIGAVPLLPINAFMA